MLYWVTLLNISYLIQRRCGVGVEGSGVEVGFQGGNSFVGPLSLVSVNGGLSGVCRRLSTPVYHDGKLGRAKLSILLFFTGGPRCGATDSIYGVHKVGDNVTSITISSLVGGNLLDHYRSRTSEHGHELMLARGTLPVVGRNERVRTEFTSTLGAGVASSRFSTIRDITRGVGDGVALLRDGRHWFYLGWSFTWLRN